MWKKPTQMWGHQAHSPDRAPDRKQFCFLKNIITKQCWTKWHYSRNCYIINYCSSCINNIFISTISLRIYLNDYKNKFFFPKKRFYIFIFIQREREGEREGEKHHNVWLPLTCPLLGTWPTHNPGMCPDWELNWRPFGSQAGTQSTEPHQPGLKSKLFRIRI